MRTTIDLPDDPHQIALSIARDKSQTLSETVAELIRAGLKPQPEIVIRIDPDTGFPVDRLGEDSNKPSPPYRRLADTNPTAYLPDLAKALWGFAWVRKGNVSETHRALAAADEAVTLFEALSQRYPTLFTDDLHGALATRAAIAKQASNP